jgi:MscS family membrane protein
MGALAKAITGLWRTHLQTQFLVPTIAEYIGAALCILGALIINKIVVHIIQVKFRALAGRTGTEVDDALIGAVQRPLLAFILIGGLFFAVNILSLSQKVGEYSLLTLKTAAIIIVTWLIIRLVDAVSIYLRDLAERAETKLDDQLIPLFTRAAKVFVGVVGLLVALQNLHVNVGGLIAGLGIAGAGIALASQDTLANVFASIVLLLDRPFTIGDWIVADDNEGIVEEIGFWSTKIRTFAKTQITIPNRRLAGAAIDNWSRIPVRRVRMTVGVSYRATADQMERIVAKIRYILRSDERIHQDFFLVHFRDFGESSLDILLNYFTNATDWAEHLQVRQEINVAIMRAIEEQGLEIAYPTRTVYVRGDKPPVRLEGGTPEPSNGVRRAQQQGLPLEGADPKQAPS